MIGSITPSDTRARFSSVRRVCRRAVKDQLPALFILEGQAGFGGIGLNH